MPPTFPEFDVILPALRRAILVTLGGLNLCSLIGGCGPRQPAKTDDPDKIEEQMKEYRKMSQKERSG